MFGKMKVISIIEDKEVIIKIHIPLGLWNLICQPAFLQWRLE
jgi:hypothetical protein